MRPLITCMVAGIQYLVHPQKIGSIEETINADALLPVTLLNTEEIFGDLDGILKLFNTYDDVFNPDFGSVLVEKPGSDNESYIHVQVRQDGSAQDVYHLDSALALGDEISELPSGPYFLHGPNLHQAWRLYDDGLEAFAFGVIPDDVNNPVEFEVLTSLSHNGGSKSIAVPSRLYSPRPSPRKPLSGVRISISEIMALAGIPSTFSSKAWASIYDEAMEVTAPYVRNLLDMGAVIVGKTKVGQFGTGLEWVDEQAPWNPRADWYQRLGGSSAGAAAGLMGYRWLDEAVGDDIFGSPNGLYSLSTYSDHISRHGIMNSSRYVSSSLLSRSLHDLSDFTAKSLGGEVSKTELPKRILFPVDLFSVMGEHQKELTSSFIRVLENYTKVKVQRINLEDTWNKSVPVNATEQSMQSFMKNAPFMSFCFEYFHFFDLFREDYRLEWDRRAFAEATPRILWKMGQTVTRDDYQKHLDHIEVFRNWFDENVMSLNATPSWDAIMVLPCDEPHAQYRDEPSTPPTILEGVTPEVLGPILQAPQLTVPFTQIPYESRISWKTEYLPFCASIIGPEGSEVMMIELVKRAFELAKWPTEVKTGQLTFPVGSTVLSQSGKPPSGDL